MTQRKSGTRRGIVTMYPISEARMTHPRYSRTAGGLLRAPRTKSCAPSHSRSRPICNHRRSSPQTQRSTYRCSKMWCPTTLTISNSCSTRSQSSRSPTPVPPQLRSLRTIEDNGGT
eukprot:PhF_6_TR19133/c0_g1_i1/m.28148